MANAFAKVLQSALINMPGWHLAPGAETSQVATEKKQNYSKKILTAQQSSRATHSTFRDTRILQSPQTPTQLGVTSGGVAGSHGSPILLRVHAWTLHP